MKHIYLFAFVFFSFLTASHAQAPKGILYQAITADPSVNILTKQNIAVRFKIFTGIPSGTQGK